MITFPVRACSFAPFPQAPVSAVGTIPPPITAAGPTLVEGQQQLTAAVGGPLETAGGAYHLSFLKPRAV